MEDQHSTIRLIKSRIRMIFQFFASQGITLAGNLIYGLLCVRLLPTTEYAKFVVLFGVQGTLVILMDVNFSGTLIPLIGEDVHDRKRIADYVASLRKLAYWLYALMSLVAILVYPRLVQRRGWTRSTVWEMVLILLVSCWFIRVSAAYGTVMILLRDRTNWYRGQMISSLGTLTLLGVLWAFHWLNGLTAILLNVAGMIFVGSFYYYRATRLLPDSGKPSPQMQRAIVRLALPNVPQAVFYALQGQISLFLIAIFGHTTAVASVGALSRLGNMFFIFTQMNPLLVAPFFAKLPKQRLAKNYLTALLITCALSATLVFCGARFPEFFLWVLGPKYQNLRFEVLLVIAGGAVACVTDVIWTINSARRFVYWINNVLNIVLILIVQILFIVKADLSTVRTVLWLTLATNIVTLLVNALSTVYGFLRGPRQVDDPPKGTSEPAIEAETYLEQLGAVTINVNDDSALPSVPGKQF
jgi:O-antigen/teichoic acid export membrane protein